MAEEGVANKAPESDAQESTFQLHEDEEEREHEHGQEQSSMIPGDTKVDQSSASMGEHCTTDRPSPPGAAPTGEISKFNDVDVYITKPADYPHSPSKLLLLLTGGTGVHSTNNQLQADRFAAEGFLVVMPDQFSGDAAPTTTTHAEAEASSGLLEQVKLGVASVAKSFTIDMWLARHTPEKVLPLLHRVLASIKEEFADAVANGGGIYAVGYCFGARYVLLLGGELGKDVAQGQRHPEAQAEEGMVTQGPQIKVAAIAHGTQITKEEIAGVSVPTCVIAVENDPLFPQDVFEHGKKALEAKGTEHEVQVYPQAPHGFAVLGDYEDVRIVEKQKEAFEQMLAWLKAH